MERRCPKCKTKYPKKGRAFDGRRAYRCGSCGYTWTEGMQGRQRRYSEQREGFQFADDLEIPKPEGEK
jgi:transposase-like protein